MAMGLFDTFYDMKECPRCGRVVEEWQTKELGQAMREFQLGDELCGSLQIREGRVAVYTDCFCEGLVSGWAVFINDAFAGVVFTDEEYENMLTKHHMSTKTTPEDIESELRTVSDDEPE